MSRFVLICVLAAGAFVPAVSAQTTASANDQNLTANELAVNAKSLYTQGKYAEAAALYRKFIGDYGAAKEAQEAVRQMRYPLAMSLLQTQKFPEAREAIDAALRNDPAVDAHLRQELVFWKAVCEMQDQEYGTARQSLEQFLAQFPTGAERNPSYAKQFPAIQKSSEARMLIGTCLLLEEKHKEAAAYFAEIESALPPADRGRATVLELYALLEAGEHDRAMDLVTEEYPRMGGLLQLITFQTLTLDLGSRYLEKQELRKAIICLQRIWTAERLLKHQEARLADLESKLQAANANPAADPYAKLLYGQMIAKVKREIESFRKIENFDSALRLRLATAYQGMQRYRESALIMEAMLNEMPPDKLVESASVNLVQSWNQIERWPKAIEAARTFAAKFPQSENLPLVMYLQGIAEQKSFRCDEAVATFDEVSKKFPDSPFAGRARFMKGFSLLLAERNAEAIAVFEEFPKKHPQHELAEPAAYWRGMAYSLDKQFPRARTAMEEYLAKYPDGQMRSAAVFRKAYCAQQLEDYTTSIKELYGYLRQFPDREENSEARVLLGDALMNEGRMDEGVAALKGINRADTRFYEEGVFKTGKAYKLLEDHDALRALMTAFKDENPRSPRVAEAVYHLGWIHRQADEPEKARDVYWEAITAYGNDPAIWSVDDLFPALAKLHRGPEESAHYQARLRGLGESAHRSDQKVLEMRTLWARAAALRKSSPIQANSLLAEAAALADVQTTNPLLLADFAQALLDTNRDDEGGKMFRELVKWNPRAPQKDRAFAALGLLELRRGNEKAALGYFERFERETLGSAYLGQVLLAKARLEEARGRRADARETLEALLASPSSAGKEKAEALFQIGDLHMKDGKPQLAVPYFQRIFVMYGRWTGWVAKAYLRSGEAFEKLDDTDSARRTYQELVERGEMADFQETGTARDRLNALGGPLPKAQPAPAQG